MDGVLLGGLIGIAILYMMRVASELRRIRDAAEDGAQLTREMYLLQVELFKRETQR